MRQAPLLLLALLLVALAGACTSGDDAPPTPSGPALSDEQYLKVICTGLANFSNALVTKVKSDEIAAVIKEYIGSLQAVNPPADLQVFHTAFVDYLKDSLSDPTSLVTRRPPLPPDDVRKRVAGKEHSVAECKNPTFFSIVTSAP